MSKFKRNKLQTCDFTQFATNDDFGPCPNNAIGIVIIRKTALLVCESHMNEFRDGSEKMRIVLTV